jgi:hypothetical protein
MQIASTTIGKLLGNDVVYSNAKATAADPGKSTTQARENAIRAADEDRDIPGGAAPPSAQAAPTSKKTITQGLMGALTKFQEELTLPQKGQSESIFKIADRYFIKFVDGIGLDGKVIPASVIENAEILPQGPKRDNTNTAAGPPATGKNGNTTVLDPLKQAVDNASHTFSITAGQMITQAIDLAIRNSSYIKNRLSALPNPEKDLKWGTPSPYTGAILDGGNFRYDHEAWIMTAQPKWFEIAKTPGKETPGWHFENLYPESNYV